LDVSKRDQYLKQLLECQAIVKKGGDEEMDIDDDNEDEEEIEEENKNTKKNFDALQFNFVSLKQILMAKDVR
jgi:hypothetical protein